MEDGADISYERLVDRTNIWDAWKTFVRGKWRQRAVVEFWQEQEKELALLYHDLNAGSYQHGPYHRFTVEESKRREVSVARVRDRVVHQMVATYLERKFAKHFYRQSYCAQRGKGVSGARMYALRLIRQLSGRHQVWVGKLDVEQYFSNIDHAILLKLLARRINDAKIMALCQEIIGSFGNGGRALPLGNLTSQWFANVYLHEVDWYVKHTLKIPYYLRYNDDMILIDTNRQNVADWINALRQFVADRLRLTIPQRKVSLIGLPQAVDILGLATNGQRMWVRGATVERAHAHSRMKASALAPELLDTLSSYCGCGINQPFSVTDLIDAYA